MIFTATPSQTVGPFFDIGLPWDDGACVVPDGAPGAVRISGRVYDGAGDLVPDCLIETWQADPEGRFADLWGHGGPSQVEGFRGFGRTRCDGDDGGWELVTVKPGPVPTPQDKPQAPHLDLSVFARGMLHRCVTRIYFGDEPDANSADPTLACLPPDRRDTLVAGPTDSGYRFDIHLQGSGETVFFAI